MFDSWTDEQFAAWLAGFFDGEGCIQVPAVGISIQIASTDRDIIEAIHARLGMGTITEVTYDRPEWRTKYDWRIRNRRETGKVLRMLRPFLTIKAAKADVALARVEAWESELRILSERNIEIIALAEQGVMYKDIALRFDLDARTVGYIVRGIIRNGLRPPKGQNIRQMRRAHESKATKSGGMGVTTTTRIHRQPPGTWRDEQPVQ